MNVFRKDFLSVISSLAIVVGVLFGVNGGKFFNNTNEEITYVEEDIASNDVAALPVTPMGLIQITTSALNVRETPNGNIKGAVNKDEIYYFYGFSGNWIQVLHKGQYGFVYSKYTNIYNLDCTQIDMNSLHQFFQNEECLATQELSEADCNVISAYEELSKAGLIAKLSAYSEAQNALQAQQAALLAALQAQQQALLQAALEAQQQAEAQKQALLAKDPSTLSTNELCDWVLAQIITPDMDNYTKATAINNWLCDHMTYDLNYYTTRDAILLGRGRCQGYANAYKNLMNRAGIPTDIITGYGNGGSHGWNRVLINGAYYYVDVTWNDSMGEYSRYLLISESEMNRDHTPVKVNPRTE